MYKKINASIYLQMWDTSHLKKDVIYWGTYVDWQEIPQSPQGLRYVQTAYIVLLWEV